MAMEDTQNMVQHWTLLFVIGLSLIIGAMIQSYIVAVHAMDWLNGIPVPPTDQIMTALMISRLALQFICVVELLFTYFFPSLFFPLLKKYFEFIDLSAIHCNIWLLTLLSVAFCLKVSNFHNVFFVHLRVLVLQRTRTQILLYVLISFALAAIFVLLPHDTQYKNATHVLMLNVSQTSLDLKRYVAVFAYGNIYPFILNFFSSVTLITSLYHHLIKMRSSKNLTTDLAPFYYAIKSVAVCLVGYALQIVNFLIVLNFYLDLGPILSYFIWNYFQVLHSGYIIYRTHKLKSKFSEILERGVSCLCNRVGHGSRSSLTT